MKSIRLQTLEKIKELSKDLGDKELQKNTLNLIKLGNLIAAYQEFIENYRQLTKFKCCVNNDKKLHLFLIKELHKCYCELSLALYGRVSYNLVHNLFGCDYYHWV